MKKLFIFFALTSLFISPVHAANLPRLKSLFQSNFDSFYEERKCGENIARLIEAARNQNIDLQGAYGLRIEGAGFLETSGFYTRPSPNQWKMLGYFHFVLVADGYVFDFDLHEPLVLPLYDYVKLQFVPPSEPMVIFGMKYTAKSELPWWNIKKYDVDHFISANPKAYAESKLVELIDLDKLAKTPRAR